MAKSKYLTLGGAAMNFQLTEAVGLEITEHSSTTSSPARRVVFMYLVELGSSSVKIKYAFCF